MLLSLVNVNVNRARGGVRGVEGERRKRSSRVKHRYLWLKSEMIFSLIMTRQTALENE